MIKLTRLNGSVLSLNPDLVHRAEETPDTVLTLIDGSRYVVLESLDELVDLVVGYRARVVAVAGAMAEEGTAPSGAAGLRHLHHRAHEPRRASDATTGHDPDEPGHEGADVVRLRSRRA